MTTANDEKTTDDISISRAAKEYVNNFKEDPGVAVAVFIGRLMGMVLTAIAVHFFLGLLFGINIPLGPFVFAYIGAHIVLIFGMIVFMMTVVAATFLLVKIRR